MRHLALLCLLLAAATIPQPLRAAERPDEGIRLLREELPKDTTIAETECERLAKAVRAATLKRLPAAPSILTAALLGEQFKDKRRERARRSCACVVRLVHASINAAPDQANTLLELAATLYPECVDALDRGGRGLGNGDGDGTGTNLGGPSLGDGNFGGGFGPGFPGSPGFSGSTPSSGLALPTPIPVAITAVVNE